MRALREEVLATGRETEALVEEFSALMRDAMGYGD